ncbi:MAG: hypothetical protein ACRDLT_13825 [Solirubrobacteraceae bacterium]
MAEPHRNRASSETLVASRTYGPADPKISDQALIDQLTTERDRYASMLVSAEQELAKRSLAESDDDLEWYRQAFLALVDSRSWRLTKPLRTFGRVMRRRVRSRTEA